MHFSERADGDFGIGAGEARERRQRRIVDRTVRTAVQVHGARAVAVDRSTAEVGEADALVTADPTIAMAVRTADCAPVALVGVDAPVVGIVHAGWRGLVAGVVEAAVSAMGTLGAGELRAVVGPRIHPCCYAFSPHDIDTVARRYGDVVRALDSTGEPALDLGAAVHAALRHCGVVDAAIDDVGSCTGCDRERWFSHRARGEVERQTSVVWLP